ncbi:MAG: hypothetical protein QUV05_19330 [Phycisphaerae bacterium]|nr:hypothetical protein [Phycisphaerae bacterium]
MSQQTTASRLPGPPRNAARGIACAIGLLLIVLAAHGVSIWDGLFFDDHWHRAAFRNYGWSPSDLMESATIDLSGRLNHLWWQERPAVWRYPRPVAMAVAKAEFVLSGGDTRIIHACALCWHWFMALLVYWLALKAGLERRWAFCAGVIFIILPHSFFSLGWTAARNAVVGTFFFTAAVAAYMSASLGHPSRWTLVRWWREALPALLWALAILSRETAVVFPFVIFLIDVSYGGRRHFSRRLPCHAVFWVLTLAFIAWRWTSFDVGNVPDIYFTKLTGWTSGYWAGSKLLQLLFSQIFYTPMLMGLATYQGVAGEELVAHAVMAVLVGLVAIWYIAVSKGKGGRWVWPLWCIAAFAPVVPVFAMPHFSYLASVPYAVMVAILLAGVAAEWRKTVAFLVIAATVWSLGVYRVAWWGIIRSEQIVYTDMVESTSQPPPPASKLFFLNLPIAAIYAPDAMREAWKTPDLEGYTLTFAPHPLMMTRPCVVEQLNDHEFTVATEPPGYFSGLPGKMLIDGMRPGSPLTPGTVIKKKPGFPFDATVVEADHLGVRKLRFRFHRPLATEGYYFYLSSPERATYRLTFNAAPTAGDGGELFRRARSANLIEREAARWEIRDKAWPIAIAMGSPIQEHLSLQSETSLARVEQWWAAHDVERRAQEHADWRSRNACLLWQRGLYFKVMDMVGRFVESDLYLTGRR